VSWWGLGCINDSPVEGLGLGAILIFEYQNLVAGGWWLETKRNPQPGVVEGFWVDIGS